MTQETAQERRIRLEHNNQVIQSIIQQLCGNTKKLKLSIGAYALYGDLGNNPSFSFRFKLCRKANYCIIVYHYIKDYYSMEFHKITPKTHKVVQTFEPVYCDQLTTTFEQYTGLYLNFKPSFG